MNLMKGISLDWTQAQALQCGRVPPFFEQLKGHILDKIRNYDPDYGRIMVDHLARTSSEAEEFLIETGCDERIAHIIAQAFSIHDAGKILQPIRLWEVTKEKPQRSADDKRERTKHGELGCVVLDGAMQELGIVPDKLAIPFIALVKAIMTDHHERLDGSGPQGLLLTDNTMGILTIIDQIDGKGKAKDLSESFDDMSGRHGREFNQEMVRKYRDSCSRRNLLGKAAPSSDAAGLQI